MMDEASARSSERGQTLILAMLAMTVIFAIGAIVVDFGLWLSERRGAQTDADFVALAGAWELLDPNGDPVGAAQASLDANDEQGNIPPDARLEVVDGECFTADVRHESRSLFAGIFGIFAPDIGAHAKACVRTENVPWETLPFEVNTLMADCFNGGTPRFDSICPLDFGAQGSNPRGLLDLQAPGDYCSASPGSGNLESVIVSGATGTCLISTTQICDPGQKGPWYDCVAVQSGNATKVIDAVRQRVDPDLQCDTDGNGTEELLETVEVVFSGPPRMYEARDCDTSTPGIQISERLVSVIVLNQAPTSGDTGYPIYGFASMYIEGCGSELSSSPAPLDPSCSVGCDDAGNGHCVVYGRLLKLVVENSGTEQPSGMTTAFSISLEE